MENNQMDLNDIETLAQESVNMETGESEVQDSQTESSNEPLTIEMPKYRDRYYTLYGGKTTPERVKLKETLNYLNRCGFGNNSLKKARDLRTMSQELLASNTASEDSRVCDFCGNIITGVEYDRLQDGRDRCMNCTRTVVSTENEFKEMFEEVKRNMEVFFDISLNIPVRVEMVNSDTLHKRIKQRRVVSKGMDARVLGVAINEKESFTLLVENGSPRFMSMLTMAHELTHIWQYKNWDAKAIVSKYGRGLELQIYEGMAKWAELQFAYMIGEYSSASMEEIRTAARKDEYGYGFIRYNTQYPLNKEGVVLQKTPFEDKTEPLSERYCGHLVTDNQ